MSEQPEKEKLPWEIKTSPSWWYEVNSWKWEETSPGKWTTAGYCPRCKDWMTDSEGRSFSTLEWRNIAASNEFRAQLEQLRPIDVMNLTAVDPSERDDVIIVRCNCVDEHPDRPPSFSTGCGQSGFFLHPNKRGH
jgi:hypothetical protein